MRLNRLLLLLLLISMAGPVFVHWFQASPSAWYRPQLVWLALIALTTLLSLHGARDDA